MSDTVVGQVLDHYEILEFLGKGGFGEVWKARDTRLNRIVAINRLPESLVHDHERRERLRRGALDALRKGQRIAERDFSVVPLHPRFVVILRSPSGVRPLQAQSFRNTHAVIVDGPAVSASQ